MPPGNTGRVYRVSQHAGAIVVNKEIKGKILAKRRKVYVEHIRHAKNRDRNSGGANGKGPELLNPSLGIHGMMSGK